MAKRWAQVSWSDTFEKTSFDRQSLTEEELRTGLRAHKPSMTRASVKGVRIIETQEEAVVRRKEEKEKEKRLQARSEQNILHLAKQRGRIAARRVVRKLKEASSNEDFFGLLLLHTVRVTKKEKSI